MGAFLILAKDNSAWLAVNFSFLIILTLTSLQVINFRLASLLSGEKPILDMMSAINKQVWSFGGFLLLVLSLFWVLNQESHIHFERLYVLIVMALMIWRMVKGLRLALQLRYKWYYLILYLCTLEILPLFILSKLALEYFAKMV
jgi:hypothetical protein